VKTTIKTCTHCQAQFDTTSTHLCFGARPPDTIAALPQPHIGMVIDKKYRLENKLGEGGMGNVFRARRLFMDDFVAIKFMRPEVMADPEIRQRFYQEAQVAARIKHPNVVTVHDFGETADGLVYLVMEFLEGMSLGQLISKNGPLELDHVVDIGIQICEALMCMLENNVIHRDLKPDNIMLVRDAHGAEVVKVVDFGVAKILESNARLTRFKARLGSPVYSSPEQFLGQYVDHRTDLYGLGIIFYECLTGHVPFEALSETELLSAIVHKMPPRLDEKIPGFASLMADLVHWLLAKNPDDRPRNACEVCKCLQALRNSKKTLQGYQPNGKHEKVEPSSPERELAGGFDRGLEISDYGLNEPIQFPKATIKNSKSGERHGAAGEPENFPSPEQIRNPRFQPRRPRHSRKVRRLGSYFIMAGFGVVASFLIWKILSDPVVHAYFMPSFHQLTSLSQKFVASGQASFSQAFDRLKELAFSGKKNDVNSLPTNQIKNPSRSFRTGQTPLPLAAVETNTVQAVAAISDVATPSFQSPAPAKQSQAETNLGRTGQPQAGSSFADKAKYGGVAGRAVRHDNSKVKNGLPSNRQSFSTSPARPKKTAVASRELPAIPAGMVLIKETVFKRGDLFGDGSANEQPAHWVRVGDFLIGQHEVTNKEYLAFVEATGKHFPEWMEPGSKYHHQTGADDFYKKLGPALYNPDHPVVGVSWHDAVKYCDWLSQNSPVKYRLPAEAEWELAARGGKTEIKYSWGNGSPQLTHGGNVGDESLKKAIPDLPIIWRAYDDSYVYTAPVGKFGANDLGIYDMTGNVWEWCGDWYDEKAYQKQERSGPAGPAQGTEKVIRGGSWSDMPAKLRLSYRRGLPPAFRSNNLGFRVAASMP
jgi:formylglycine-generating enzyme required for sulfatase activity